MRCHQCSSVMQQTDSIDDRGVCQIWYDCPVCEARHTVVQPGEIRLFGLGKSQRFCGGPATTGAQPLRIR